MNIVTDYIKILFGEALYTFTSIKHYINLIPLYVTS